MIIPESASAQARGDISLASGETPAGGSLLAPKPGATSELRVAVVASADIGVGIAAHTYNATNDQRGDEFSYFALNGLVATLKAGLWNRGDIDLAGGTGALTDSGSTLYDDAPIDDQVAWEVGNKLYWTNTGGAGADESVWTNTTGAGTIAAEYVYGQVLETDADNTYIRVQFYTYGEVA